MPTLFLDTNILLRYIIGDVPRSTEFVTQLFNSAITNKQTLIVLPQVIIELHHVLLHYYKLEKETIGEILSKIFELSFIEFEQKEILKTAIQTYSKTNISLEDAYYLHYCRAHDLELVTFDKKLKTIWKK